MAFGAQDSTFLLLQPDRGYSVHEISSQSAAAFPIQCSEILAENQLPKHLPRPANIYTDLLRLAKIDQDLLRPDQDLPRSANIYPDLPSVFQIGSCQSPTTVSGGGPCDVATPGVEGVEGAVQVLHTWELDGPAKS